MVGEPRTILITGVTGQDGSYLAERLVAEGHEVHGFVYRSDEAEVTTNVHVHAGDLMEFDSVDELIPRVSPEQGLQPRSHQRRRPVLGRAR